jgi:hypothetical protein
MPKSDFIPRTDGNFVAWLDQFKTSAASIGMTLGITGTDTAAIAAAAADVHAKVDASTAADATAQQATQSRRESRRAAEMLVRNLARRVKTHRNYTVALGEQLGIEGPEDTTDLTTAKPKLTGKPLPMGAVEVSFSKSKSDGVNIYAQRDGDTGWVFLARDTHSPYVDNRPLLAAGKPEARRYRAYYVLSDHEIGQPSDEVVVTCQP